MGMVLMSSPDVAAFDNGFAHYARTVARLLFVLAIVAVFLGALSAALFLTEQRASDVDLGTRQQFITVLQTGTSYYLAGAVFLAAGLFIDVLGRYFTATTYLDDGDDWLEEATDDGDSDGEDH
jgi:hypothetical protein